MDHAGKIIVNNNIDPTIPIEPFNAEVPGLYNLKLLNPTDQVLEAAIGFGDQDAKCWAEKPYLCHDCAIVVPLLVVGIALVIAADVIITILDRSQINKMKKFGDISDLI